MEWLNFHYIGGVVLVGGVVKLPLHLGSGWWSG